jgi:hypothetical protein
MKLIQRLSLPIFIASIAMLTACEMAIPPFGPTDRPDQPVVILPAEPLTDTIGWNVPAEALTVAQAREICAALESGSTSGTKHYVMGFVKKLHNNHASGVSGYGNAQFYMEEEKGANSSQDFMAFQVYGLDGTKLTDPNAVAVGDFVVIYGELTNYNGTYETVGKGAAHIWKSTNPLLAPAKPEPVEVTIFEQNLGTKDAIDTFIVANIAGDAQWQYKRQTTNMRTEINAANNEDWLITPALDLTQMSEASLNFKYKFSVAIPAEFQNQYTVVVSKDFDGNPANIATATWIEIKGFSYETTAYAESGVLNLPAEMIGHKCHIAWKYKTADTPHTWALKDVIVKAMTKVD